ncbi:MAG: hypothetical protein U0413_03125 [Candidatus Saccharimonadales bacterium]
MSREFRQFMVELNRLTANGNELQLKDSILADALSMGETHNLPITPETIVGRKRQSQVVLSSGIVSLEFVTYNEVAGMTEPDNAWRNDNNGVLIGEFRARGGAAYDPAWDAHTKGFFAIDASLFPYSDERVEDFSEFEGPFFDEEAEVATKFRAEVADYLRELRFPVRLMDKLQDTDEEYESTGYFLEPEEVAKISEGLSSIN